MGTIYFFEIVSTGLSVPRKRRVVVGKHTFLMDPAGRFIRTTNNIDVEEKLRV